MDSCPSCISRRSRRMCSSVETSGTRCSGGFSVPSVSATAKRDALVAEPTAISSSNLMRSGQHHMPVSDQHDDERVYPRRPRSDIEEVVEDEPSDSAQVAYVAEHYHPRVDVPVGSGTTLRSDTLMRSDVKTAKAVANIELAVILSHEARRMVYSLGLHRELPREGLTFIETQVCRRLFWEVYQNDKWVELCRSTDIA